MEKKNILGLDIGPNSIGWAIVEAEQKKDESGEVFDECTRLLGTGSRIVPMGQDELGDFEKGVLKSKASERTGYRGARRRYERRALRRQRLNRVLDLLGFLPEHYAAALNRYGELEKGSEARIAWKEEADGQSRFLFKSSFDEMVTEFRAKYPGMRVPYDWTIYYLRKKALSEAITPQELAWVLHSFNAKRGYYQLRGKDEEDTSEDNKKELKELVKASIVAIEKGDAAKGGRFWWNYILDNGLTYKRQGERPMEWLGSERYFIVATKLDNEGNPKLKKDGAIDQSISAPSPDDWGLQKMKTEREIEESGKYYGAFIFDKILENPAVKIIGGEVTVVDRRFYRDELYAILDEQKKHIPQLRDRKLYAECIEALYPNNDAHRNIISRKDFTYLLTDDVILYQRPLKSKKYLISDCPYESVTYTDSNGERHRKGVKCVPKSHPLFQEFRVWQFLANLRIYQAERDNRIDVDVTGLFLKTEADRVALFDWLNSRANVKQEELLKFLFELEREKSVAEQAADFGELFVLPPGSKQKKDKKDKELLAKFGWNYVADKQYPCNKTRAAILSKLATDEEREALTADVEEIIWHALYSIIDKKEFDKAFRPNSRHPETGLYAELSKRFSEESIAGIKQITLKESDYGSYSRKALAKMLPLMRIGSKWSLERIDGATLERINKLIDGEYDEGIDDRTRRQFANLTKPEQFQGLATWQACYVAYGRHSEASEIIKWNTPDDLREYVAKFPHNSLRNPTVERIILETLRTVEDIWRQYGHIDEVHVELARSVKQNKEQRERATRQMADNERRNLRLRAMLEAFLNDRDPIGFDADQVINPGSPNQQLKLQLFEDCAISYAQATGNADLAEMLDIQSRITGSNDDKSATPAQIRRYALWLEQNFRSPYTGETISLARLFTDDYQVDHIIPRALYWDDSFNNKVLCEASVNSNKSNSLAFDYIAAHQGETVILPKGKKGKILSLEEYQELVLTTFKSNKSKCEKLLMKEIPVEFTQRQLNDTRYISKVVKSLLSNVVREQDADGNLEPEAISKNVIVPVGSMTDSLKKDWGLKDVWNQLVLPRFKALNAKQGTGRFTATTSNGHEIPAMPVELSRGFSKKRIDHRHHALDAIVIACTTRRHIQYINSDNAMAETEKKKYIDKKRVEDARRALRAKIAHKVNDKEWLFNKPWATFTEDVKKALEGIIVSFKQTNKVIAHTSNKFQRYENGKKCFVKQTKGDSFAVRKPLHEEHMYGKVSLRRRGKFVSIKQALVDVKSIVDKDLKKELHKLLSLGLNDREIKKYFENNRESWSDINLNRIEIYYFSGSDNSSSYAIRDKLDVLEKKNREAAYAKIDSITDSGIRSILKRFLDSKGGDPKVAFCAEGIDELNSHIEQWNEGKPHKPIYRVRFSEVGSARFAVGRRTEAKKRQFVQAGSNPLFAVIGKVTDNGLLRTFRSIPIFTAIELARGEKNGIHSHKLLGLKSDEKLLFTLKPRDLIYISLEDESQEIEKIDHKRIYTVYKFSGEALYVLPNTVTGPIVKGKDGEYGSQDRIGLTKSEKERMIPVKVDRLGNITWIYDPTKE